MLAGEERHRHPRALAVRGVREQRVPTSVLLGAVDEDGRGLPDGVARDAAVGERQRLRAGLLLRPLEVRRSDDVHALAAGRDERERPRGRPQSLDPQRDRDLSDLSGGTRTGERGSHGEELLRPCRRYLEHLSTHVGSGVRRAVSLARYC